MKVSPLIVGEFGVNCFIVAGVRDQAIVIDPGAEAPAILAALDELGLSVAAYVLTHGHVDHVSAVAELYDARPAPVAISAEDLRWAFGPANQLPPFYGPPRQPGRVERTLQDGVTFTDAGLAYRIISTPGHTPGGVCLHFEKERAVFTGDTLFAGSVGRTDLPGGSSRLLSASLRKLAALDDATAVYPGHGPTTNIAEEKRSNAFLRGGFV
jgi:hydroxyacylglutathione hydrolase